MVLPFVWLILAGHIIIALFCIRISLTVLKYSLKFFFWLVKICYRLFLSFFIFFYRIIHFPEVKPQSSESLDHKNSFFLLQTYVFPLLDPIEDYEQMKKIVYQDYDSRLAEYQRELIMSTKKYHRMRHFRYVSVKKINLMILLFLPFILMFSWGYYLSGVEYKKRNLDNTIKVFQVHIKNTQKDLVQTYKKIEKEALKIYNLGKKVVDTKISSKTVSMTWDMITSFPMCAFYIGVFVFYLFYNYIALTLFISYACWWMLYYTLMGYNESMKSYLDNKVLSSSN